jgi:hypothetical protein
MYISSTNAKYLLLLGLVAKMMRTYFGRTLPVKQDDDNGDPLSGGHHSLCFTLTSATESIVLGPLHQKHTVLRDVFLGKPWWRILCVFWS